jgi:hypothetical protein
MHRDDPEAFSGLAIGELRVRGAATQRLAIRAPERHVHAAGGVVILGAGLFRAMAQQLELPRVIENASALCAVVRAWFDVRCGPDQLISAIADDALQRALQADRLPQVSRCRALGTVCASRAEFLNCQHTGITACNLTCHITRARQPTPAIISPRSADIEGANTQCEGTRLLAYGEHFTLAKAGRFRTRGLSRFCAAADYRRVAVVGIMLFTGDGCLASTRIRPEIRRCFHTADRGSR